MDAISYESSVREGYVEKWRALEGGCGGWSSTVQLDICMARASGEQIRSANCRGKDGSERVEVLILR